MRRAAFPPQSNTLPERRDGLPTTERRQSTAETMVSLRQLGGEPQGRLVGGGRVSGRSSSRNTLPRLSRVIAFGCSSATRR